MRIATWNVNSLRARLESVTDWLRRREPDVLCMQETKVLDEDFPSEEFYRLGYELATAGQKSYNGVAIASRLPLTEVTVGLADTGLEDDKRVIAATVDGLRIYSVYAPNGKLVDSPTFEAKLTWFHHLRATLESRPRPPGGVLLAGDFNIAPEARDVFDPVAMQDQLHFHPREHAALAHLKAFGLRDAFRLHHQAPGNYSWWDYRAGAFRRNHGLRIDYVLITEELASRCTAAYMDRDERGREKPSDHCPVIAEFS